MSANGTNLGAKIPNLGIDFRLSMNYNSANKYHLATSGAGGKIFTETHVLHIFSQGVKHNDKQRKRIDNPYSRK